MTEPLPPAYIKFARQNGVNADCVVAAISTLFCVTYEEALAACLVAQPDVLESGMSWPDVIAAVEELGAEARLVRRGRYDIEEATGLLNVKNTKEDHVTVLWAGRIVEGNGELWLFPDDYFGHYKYRPYSLLVRTK
jgi:hypothetical protein